MDILTQRLIAFYKQTLAELRRISGAIQKHDDTTRESSQARDEYNGHPPEPLLIDVAKGVEVRKSGGDAKQDSDRHYQMLFVQSVLCLATIGAFVAAAIYAGVAHRTYREIRAQTGSVKEAADAAKSAADTAAETLKSNKEQFKIEERPYVTAAVFQVTPMPASVGAFHIILRLSNSGRTPATKVTIFPQAFIGERRLVLDNPKARSEVFIGSDKDTENGYTINLAAADAQSIGDKTKQFTLKGTVAYSDIFEDSHRTSFCMYYSTEEKNYKYCPQGNDVR